MKKAFLKTILILAAAILAAAFLLSSCAVGNSYKGAPPGEMPSDSYSDSFYDVEEYPLPGTEPKGGEKSADGQSAGMENKEDYSSKLIKEITISGETKNFDEAKDSIAAAVGNCGGYVESSNVQAARYNSFSGGRRLTMTIRVPSERLSEFSDAVSGNINVYSSQEKLSDVTSSYYDMKARMETLITKRDALTRMLEQAKDLSEILTIQDRLYETIADIEAYETALRGIDSKVTYSTIHLTLDEVKEYTPGKEESFGKRFSDAFVNGWKGFGAAMQDFAVWLVGAMPALLLLFVIFVVPLFIILGCLKSRRRKRAKAAGAAKAEQQGG